jgi:tRNA nucleotidyltransferase (CCA-adding enzyme)
MDLLERLRAEPGGAQLLAVAQPGAFLVGGAVRDLLLGRHPRELDVVVEGDPQELIAALDGHVEPPGGETAHPPARAGMAVVEHPRFGTAIVELPGARVDIAKARRERYPAPGELPQVEPAPLAEDLLRRDFTVNAIALALAGLGAGELQAPAHALEDLRAGRLRVLHERSFLDDPTRLLRLARYQGRLGFAIEPRTAELAAAALAQGALGTVSGARVGAELRLALSERDRLAALGALDRLGVLGALHPRLRFERPVVDRALALLGARGAEGAGLESGSGGLVETGHADEDRPDLLVLAALVLPLALRAGEPRAEIAGLLDRLEFTASERDRAAAAAAAVPGLIERLAATTVHSELRTAASAVPPEGVALAGAVSEPAAASAARWLSELRHIGLRIDGGDLLAAGIPQGPEIGRRLEDTLRRRLDGELPDEREAQLRAARES